MVIYYFPLPIMEIKKKEKKKKEKKEQDFRITTQNERLSSELLTMKADESSNSKKKHKIYKQFCFLN